MSAGNLDRRVTFLRRPDDGGERVAFCTLWAEWRPASTARRVEAHALTDGIEGQLCVRDSARARTIKQTDRAQFSGEDFAVISTPVADRSGWLWIKVGREIGSGG